MEQYFPALSIAEYRRQQAYLRNQINKYKMEKLKLVAIEDRVIIEVDKAEEVTAGGIIIPEAAKERPLIGTIVGVGPGIYAIQTGVFCPTTVKPGQRVAFSKYAGSEFTYKDETYLIMRQGDIYCLVED